MQGMLKTKIFDFTVLWEVTPCSLVDRLEILKKTRCFRLIPWKIRKRFPLQRQYVSTNRHDATSCNVKKVKVKIAL